MLIKNIKNKIIAVIMVLFASLVIVSPVIANTSSWYFLAYYYGLKVNGKNNGVFHQMDTGYVTIAGTLETTAIYGSPVGNEGWTFEVWKDAFFDTKQCSVGKIPAPDSWGDRVNFSQGCGNISSGSYYLIIWRGALDNREVEGWGTLSN